jgi:hypothetical protein
MTFSTSSSGKFGKVFETSPYQVEDPLVKIQHVAKGSNIVFGRSLREGHYDDLLYLGKILEATKGRSYLGCDAWLDTTFPHVIYITGTRGSGKSFDLGVLLEGISTLATPSPIQNNVTPITSIVIDTQSQFWTLGYDPNPHIPANKSQLEELARWNISPNRVTNIQFFSPPTTQRFLGSEQMLQVRPADVQAEEWCALLGQDLYSPQGHVLMETVAHLQGRNYEITDMVSYIGAAAHWPNTQEATRNAVLYKLEDYRRSGLFAATGFQVKDLLKPGSCSILLLRDLRNEDKSLITSIIARNLFSLLGQHHTKKKTNSFFKRPVEDDGCPDKVWLVIDEAHVVAPCDSPSPAREALVEYVKRGRDAGLSLVLATQQPSALDDRILSQVNLSFNHRLGFQADITAALNRIPTKGVATMKFGGSMLTDFAEMIRVLDAGQCFIGDQASSRAVLTLIRPRVTAHGGYSPI